MITQLKLDSGTNLSAQLHTTGDSITTRDLKTNSSLPLFLISPKAITAGDGAQVHARELSIVNISICQFLIFRAFIDGHAYQTMQC